MSGGLDGQVFRQAMAALPTGVSVLTTKYGTGVHGMTVGSLTSVSLSPALISVCLRKESPTLLLIRRNGDFGLSVLADDQVSVADCFATPERETDSVEYFFLDGVPVVSGAVGWLVCTERHIYAAGDHAIVIGAVSRAESRAGEPLIRHRSRYRHLTPEEESLVTPR
jgi:flavin reductase (DIM6/NTAB) family NADH-FMN oxidoreductase RutF